MVDMEEMISSAVDRNLYRFLEELCDFLRIPSVSARSEHREDMVRASSWLRDQLGRLNIETQIYTDYGHPLVYGSYCPYADKPTILIYGHYDVQPEDPVELWETPPFDPSIRDGSIYARGATDDKGQLFTWIKALEVLRATSGRIPVNVKILIEGEEEIGSPNLHRFLVDYKKRVSANVIVISDGSKYSRDTPAITYGLRGLSYLEIEVIGPQRDLHSGVYGGIVKNPLNALVEILAKLTDEKGQITIPGFYEDVVPLEPWEREEMEKLALKEDEVRDQLGVDSLFGEEGFSALERKTARPTLDINGIWGGYQGEGAKTVIPSKAGAKLSMRLVPNQSHQKIDRLASDFIKSLTPPGVKVYVKQLHGTDPVIVPRNLKEMEIAIKAIKKGFGKEPVFIREGGSIPVVVSFSRLLNIQPILLLGWGNPDDGPHGPNEHFSIENFKGGIKTAAFLLEELGKS
ncbi:MAG: dipeptidase [Syntrophobacterales bacterium]|nr:dipeptidase [Syntrophobacterales bacterium]